MTYRDQIRDWIGGLWSDFWNVPLGAVLIAILAILWAFMELVWRSHAAVVPATNLSYHAHWPVRLLLGFGVLSATVARAPSLAVGQSSE